MRPEIWQHQSAIIELAPLTVHFMADCVMRFVSWSLRDTFS